MGPYKNLILWQKAMVLAKDVYDVTSRYPQSEVFGLVSQMRRCAVSIPSNIAEGCGRFSNNETSRFITISLGSLAELDTQLLIAQHLHFVDDITEVSKQVDKVNALLVGLKNI